MSVKYCIENWFLSIIGMKNVVMKRNLLTSMKTQIFCDIVYVNLGDLNVPSQF